MKLIICVFNVENLFIKEVTPSNYIFPYKSKKKLSSLANSFKDINADIYCLLEVGGIENLQYFNFHYLDNLYTEILVQGNSDRNIHIGYLVKKSSCLHFNLFNFKEIKLNFNYPHELKLKEQDINYELPKHKMSRDLTELHFFKNQKKSDPLFIIFLVHLKSKIDIDKIDFLGKRRREAEMNFSLNYLMQAQKKYTNIPIILSGDFNGNASRENTEVEFKRIEELGYIDILESSNLPIQEKATYYTFPNNNKINPIQLDYAFIHQKYQSQINNAYVYRYKKYNGKDQDFPHSKYDLKENPSDHFPLVYTLNL